MTEVLRYGDPEAVDHPLYGRYATIAPGAPGRCPECEDFGYIDGADLVRGFQHQHCRGCGTRWGYQFDEAGAILEVHGLPAAAPASQRLAALAEVLDLRTTPDPTPAPVAHELTVRIKS